LDAPWLSRLSSDEALSFEGEDHLVDGWWRDLEMALHVGFGGRSFVDVAVGYWPCFSVKRGSRGA
jgi:hypothetical protein